MRKILKIKQIIAAACMFTTMATMLSGCNIIVDGTTSEPENQGETSAYVQNDGSDNKVITDNKSLYEKDQDTSIVTMYLTVSEGNQSDNTNHTWNEVNSHSVYDYYDMGVERDAVEGLLQVGSESGPIAGELGYGMNIPNATVTIRGQTSSRSAQKSYKIKIKDGKGSWNDQQTINLNKHVGEGLRFRNKLSFDLIKEMSGMIALQTQFVHLYVKDNTGSGNGTFADYGLYTQVEQPNKSFLKRHGLDSYGQLYKINYFEFYKNEDVIKLKSDADYDVDAFENLLEIKGSDDHSKLIAMLADVNNYSLPIEQVMDKWFEQDNILSWLSFNILTGNTDTQSRNTLIYSPLNGNTWYFICWDNDTSFFRTEAQVRGTATEGNWETGVSNYWGNVLMKRILRSDTYRAALGNKINEQRAVLTESYLTQKVAAYRQVVEPFRSQQPDQNYNPLTQAQFEQVCAALPREVEQNYQSYRESLEKPMPFFIGVPEVKDGKTRFVWDNAYDFDMEDVSYTFELANNYNFSNPIAIREGSYGLEYDYDGTLAPGQYFIRVRATNESGQSQSAFDYYVTKENTKIYGTKCFYVLADGTIEEDVYEE